jgi:hypothetical protein
VNDEPSTPVIRRRTLILASLGAAALACVGLAWRALRAGPGQSAGERNSADLKRSLLAFIGGLFGRNLSALDVEELSERLDELLAAGGILLHDAAVLVQQLDELAQKRGASGFASCSSSQKADIVEQVMSIDPKSLRARVLSHLSRSQRDFYRMRWSVVPQLVWLYRHSGAAWRARGYTRWPGVAGDWRETLAPGAPYP